MKILEEISKLTKFCSKLIYKVFSIAITTVILSCLFTACSNPNNSNQNNNDDETMLWTASTINSTGFVDITYGNGRFVAVELGGKMAYSLDGITWTLISNNIFGTGSMWGIGYGDNKFICVGQDKMVYSYDGIAWTAVKNNPFDTNNTPFGTLIIRDIIYNNDRFIVVGDYGQMAYSYDGITWTAISDSTFGSSTIWGIAYGGYKFVAVGQDGKMAYSYDGITWTAVNESTFDIRINAIVYGDGRFVAVG